MTGAVGLAVTLYGAIRDQPAHSLSGVCITMIALTALILLAIQGNRRSIADTRDERRALAIAQGQAMAEQSRYLAAQAALEIEQGRLNRDMAAERAALAARLKAECDQLREEFEERRAALIAETMETTFLLMRGNKFDPTASAQGNLIPFPDRQPQPQRARSREHGVVGP